MNDKIHEKLTEIRKRVLFRQAGPDDALKLLELFDKILESSVILDITKLKELVHVKEEDIDRALRIPGTHSVMIGQLGLISQLTISEATYNDAYYKEALATIKAQVRHEFVRGLEERAMVTLDEKI